MIQRGFTLIELLVALLLFSLIAVLAYGAMYTASDGFQLLSQVRQAEERSSWTGRQLRSDLTYLANPRQSPSSSFKIAPTMALRIINDNRGDVELDELWLQVSEPGGSEVTRVHYYIDEELGKLVRESRSMLARDQVKAVRWDMGAADSWSIEVLDQHGNWRQDWGLQQGNNIWPKAVRVTLRRDKGMTVTRRWMVPLYFGVAL